MSNEYARKVLTSQKKELEIIVDSQPSGNDVRNQVVNINQLQQAINLLQSDVIASNKLFTKEDLIKAYDFGMEGGEAWKDIRNMIDKSTKGEK